MKYPPKAPAAQQCAARLDFLSSRAIESGQRTLAADLSRCAILIEKQAARIEAMRRAGNAMAESFKSDFGASGDPIDDWYKECGEKGGAK